MNENLRNLYYMASVVARLRHPMMGVIPTFHTYNRHRPTHSACELASVLYCAILFI